MAKQDRGRYRLRYRKDAGWALATEDTEFTERFFLLPSTKRPALQQGAYQMGKDLFLCVLGDLCGNNFLTRGRPKRSMA